MDVDITTIKGKNDIFLIENNVDSLISLIAATKKLNIFRVNRSDFANDEGKIKKIIELGFNEDFYGVRFFYYVFDKNLNTSDSLVFYNNRGGDLSKKIAWHPRSLNE